MDLSDGEPTGEPVVVPCDPECWSEPSKRSVEYTHGMAPGRYHDQTYLCWRCRTPDVFTAAEQKHTFEVRKAHRWQHRVLCRACHRERIGLEHEAGECRRRWIADGAALRRDQEFLQRWLVVLQSLPRYGGARDEANIVMLRRLVAEVQPHAEPSDESRGRR